MVHVTKQNPDVSALSVRLPKPLHQATASISAITGESINSIVVGALETWVANYATTTNHMSLTISVPDLDTMVASYASTPHRSQPRREPLSLSKWTSTPEEEKTDEK